MCCTYRRGLVFVFAAIHEIIEAREHVYMCTCMQASNIDQSGNLHYRTRVFVCMHLRAMVASARGTHELICMHLCSGFCSNLCAVRGVRGVCCAMSSDWSREDFFHLTSTDIHKLKLQLAQKCDIHYGVCNQEKDMGFTSNGVMGLKAAALMDRVKAVAGDDG